MMMETRDGFVAIDDLEELILARKAVQRRLDVGQDPGVPSSLRLCTVISTI
jgi:hypothetical protein